MISSVVLLVTRASAVGAARTFFEAVSALGQIAAFLGFNVPFFCLAAVFQTTGGFLALFGWCLFDAHCLLHQDARITHRHGCGSGLNGTPQPVSSFCPDDEVVHQEIGT